MTSFAIRRFLQSIPVLLLISITSFTIISLAPGGLMAHYEDPNMTAADIQRLEESLGMNEPAPVRYAKWLVAIVGGDLGRSYSTREPVLSMILDRLPATLELTVGAMVLGGTAGIALGVWSALHHGSRFDTAVRILSVAGSAVPHWWLGLICIVIFAGVLHVLPSGGRYTIGRGFDIFDHLRYLVLPLLVLSTGPLVGFSRFARAEMRDVLQADYMRTATAKGLAFSDVIRQHALRNTLIPIVTIIGMSLPGLFSGAALTEIVFSWPGIGQMALAMASKRDIPVLMGLLMISSTLVVMGNFLADLLYGIVDPRVKYQ